MSKIIFENGDSEMIIFLLNEDNEIQIETSYDFSYLSIDQTKQLIEFLTKQIEEK